MVENWQHAGLFKRSTIKPVIFTVEQRLVRPRFGKLNPNDLAALTKALGEIIGL